VIFAASSVWRTALAEDTSKLGTHFDICPRVSLLWQVFLFTLQLQAWHLYILVKKMSGLKLINFHASVCVCGWVCVQSLVNVKDVNKLLYIDSWIEFAFGRCYCVVNVAASSIWKPVLTAPTTTWKLGRTTPQDACWGDIAEPRCLITRWLWTDCGSSSAPTETPRGKASWRSGQQVSPVVQLSPHMVHFTRIVQFNFPNALNEFFCI
jgi:hypothetical protein